MRDMSELRTFDSFRKNTFENVLTFRSIESIASVKTSTSHHFGMIDDAMLREMEEGNILLSSMPELIGRMML
jgi:hypothetical protein